MGRGGVCRPFYCFKTYDGNKPVQGKPHIGIVGFPAEVRRINPVGMNGAIISEAVSHRVIRNSRTRKSHHISTAAAANIMEAAYYAQEIGIPFNRFITIHWEKAGVKENSPNATSRFLKLASDFLSIRGQRLAYAWVRETGQTKGHHAHVLLYVPVLYVREFSRRQRGWVKLCGGVCYKGVIKTKPIGRSY